MREWTKGTGHTWSARARTNHSTSCIDRMSSGWKVFLPVGGGTIPSLGLSTNWNARICHVVGGSRPIRTLFFSFEASDWSRPNRVIVGHITTLRSYLPLFFFRFSTTCRRVFNKTIILLGLAGYEMIITNSALRASLVIYHFTSSAPS